MRRPLRSLIIAALLAFLALAVAPTLRADEPAPELRGTGDLGLVVERASGSVLVVDTSARAALGRIEGLGDLSHASAVFSRDGRHAYIFGRDGGLTKVDLLLRRIEKRIVQGGNSIGGAISQDGTVIGVANYEPGGVRLFDARTLDLIADIPAAYGDDGKLSKVLGLVDAPGRRFVFSLYDAGEIWVADAADPAHPIIRRYADIGKLPYDGVVTPDGRYYVAGLFGEDGVALLDLWNEGLGVRRVLNGYGHGEEALPVYKMPHLESWASTQDEIFLPAVGRHEVLIVDRRTWRETGRIPVHGQPVFVVARPDGRQMWVNFAHPDNDVVQVIDVPTRKIVKELRPGPAVLHLEFTPRGDEAWISVRDEDRIDVYDTESFERVASLPAEKPSGIFFTARANRIGF